MRALFRLVAACGLFCATGAWAEVNEVRIPKGAGGVGFLPLLVMEERSWSSRRPAKMGLTSSAPNGSSFGGPAVVNDMLLSGEARLRAGRPAGLHHHVGPHAASNMKVKGVAAMTSIPMYLNTNRRTLKSLHDLDAERQDRGDRGEGLDPGDHPADGGDQGIRQGRLRALRPLHGVADASGRRRRAALGRTEITAHFTSPPFHQRERKDPTIRTIMTSNEVMGGAQHLHDAVFDQPKFHDENPKALCGGAQGAAGIDRLHQHRQERRGRGVSQVRARARAGSSTTCWRSSTIPTSASRPRRKA